MTLMKFRHKENKTTTTNLKSTETFSSANHLRFMLIWIYHMFMTLIIHWQQKLNEINQTNSNLAFIYVNYAQKENI